MELFDFVDANEDVEEFEGDVAVVSIEPDFFGGGGGARFGPGEFVPRLGEFGGNILFELFDETKGDGGASTNWF